MGTASVTGGSDQDWLIKCAPSCSAESLAQPNQDCFTHRSEILKNSRQHEVSHQWSSGWAVQRYQTKWEAQRLYSFLPFAGTVSFSSGQPLIIVWQTLQLDYLTIKWRQSFSKTCPPNGREQGQRIISSSWHGCPNKVPSHLSPWRLAVAVPFRVDVDDIQSFDSDCHRIKSTFHSPWSRDDESVEKWHNGRKDIM